MNSQDPKLPYLGTLSGDFESMELTESQTLIVDILKSMGKVSAIVSESPTKFKVEKLNGLENYAYAMKKAQDAGEAITPELVQRLEKARYEEMEEKIGNRTEILRVLISGLATDKRFREIQHKMVEEVVDLCYKRKSNREIAEQTQTNGWEN